MKTKAEGDQRGNALVITTLSILLVLACSAFFSYNFRIVRTLEGIIFVEKSKAGFEQTFVDITNWTLSDLFSNRQIAMDVIDSGHASGIPQVAAFNHAVDQGIDSMKAFDKQYGISDGFEWTVDRVQEIDREYKISEHMGQAVEDVNKATKEIQEEINEEDNPR